jgi:hypothetical protein
LTWGGELNSPKKGAVTVIRQKKKGQDAATGSATGNHVAFYVSSTTTDVRLLWRQSERFRKILKLLLERLRRERIPLAFVTARMKKSQREE